MPVTIQPTSLKYKNSNNEFQTVTAIKGDSGVYYGETAPSDPNVNVWIDPNGEAETFVQDVQVNGTSVVTDGVANVPVATYDNTGVVKLNATYGLAFRSSPNQDTAMVARASSANIKGGQQGYQPIVPGYQHESVFYGLAKLAGADMASSSNPVGTYTEEAKIAIQKMLGIYQPPWELIREDTGTNATSADIEIAVDGNGQAFELTDIRILFTTPTQETNAIVGNYGRIRCLRSGTDISDNLYIGAYSQTAQATGKISAVQIIQQNGMIERTNWKNITNNSDRESSTILTNPSSSAIWELSSRTYDKIEIQAVTGTWKYWLYGKRKWQ